MWKPFRRSTEEVQMGQMLVATFTGRSDPQIAGETFGWLMMKLKLWGKLTSAEDVALHNVALEIMNEMRAGPTVSLKDLGKIVFLIEHERPEDAP